MKKTICWLLLFAMLLGGCSNTVSAEREEQPIVNHPILYEPVHDETVTEPPIPEDSGSANTVPAVEGYESFVNVLSAALIQGEENKNISPVSVYLALAMAVEGAQGKTQAELLALLGEENLENLRQNAESLMNALLVKGKTGELVLANSIWLGMQDGNVTFHENYLNTLAESYGAEAYSVRFGETDAGRRIASWIQEKTRDKIRISEDAMTFDMDTLAVLLNTIYLKDGWRTPFDPEKTEQGIFHGLHGKELSVNYMHRTDKGASIVRGEGYLRYALPLKGVGRMVFVLPDEGVSLESVLGSSEKIDELLHSGKEIVADVNLMVPKFTFQDRTDLEETLIGLGVYLCFTGDADFSNMTDTPAHISRVLQESYIGVDENGVEAAAYTMVALDRSAVSMEKREKVDFHLIRPFLYTIEAQDGTILFIGTVTEPDKAQ
jgi:serpin B